VPTTQVIKPIRGKRMRLTRLDECGTPVVGPASTLVTKGFISLGLSPQYEDGETITQANAQGDYEVNEPADSWLTRIDVEGAFIGVHPDVVEMLTGNPVVLDGTGNAVGFRLQGGAPILGGWAVEVWTGRAGQVCASGAPYYGYSLLPFLRGGKLGDVSIENGAINLTISSSTRENPGWGSGPYSVVLTGVAPGTPGPLIAAIGARDHWHLQRTAIAPPAVTTGTVALPPP
jgi:hypothetical protein